MTLLGMVIASKSVYASPDERLVNLWNRRFCELVILTGSSIKITALVFSTVGFNDCPQADFDEVDTKSLERQFGARKILKISPSHLLVDEILLAKPELPLRFGALEMQKLNSFEAPSVLIARGKWPPYSEIVLNRKSRIVWPKHKPLYTLISSSGDRYVMRSYSHSVDPTLSLSDLEGLGTKLKLPPRWRFQVEPDSDGLILENMAQCVIIQDPLGNRYQKIEPKSP